MEVVDSVVYICTIVKRSSTATIAIIVEDIILNCMVSSCFLIFAVYIFLRVIAGLIF